MTAKTFWGNFLVVIGGFVAIFAGGCGVIFEIVAFTTSDSVGENYFGRPIVPLIAGGIPALVGYGVYRLGKWLRKPPAGKDTGGKKDI